MITHILTDIEGTTSSISFVKNVLFPYARYHLPAFVENNKQEPSVSACLDQVAIDTKQDRNDTHALIAQLIVWIDQDVKKTSLKTLQGMIWKYGYIRGDYKAHVYADAYEALHFWKTAGYDLAVYSSGSVQAQKLFFQYSDFGDMRPLFSHYFDTTIGHKREGLSYKNIREVLDVDAENILFLSDIKEELIAAKYVGYKTCWLVRETGIQESGQGALAETGLPYVKTFAEIDLATFR